MWDSLPVQLLATAGRGTQWDKLPQQFVSTLVFTAVGLAFFALSFWVIARVVPFSMRKEIEEDQNTALAIIIGAVILGISIIVAAAVHGQ